MDETKVQIGEDVLLDIGTHSDWYISTLCYDNESVNVELRRKTDRYNEWWIAEQTEPSNSEKPNNCEAKNYCDDCLYTDTCDSKEFFYACTSKATISKMEQVDEPQTSGVMWTEDAIKDEPKSYSTWASTDEPQTDCAWR